MTLPFMGPGVGVVLKGVMSVFLAFMLFPGAAMDVTAPSFDFYYLILIGQEVFAGLMMGFVVRLSFTIISVAGEMTSQEMGFMMSKQMDPITGAQTPAITQFYRLVAFMLFQGINGHYWVREVLARSFRTAPIGSITLSVGLGEWLTGLFTRTFLMGVQLAAPIFLLMMMITIGIGMLVKLVEGLNVFDIGFPIRIGAGFIFILTFMPYLGQSLHRVFKAVGDNLLSFLMAI